VFKKGFQLLELGLLLFIVGLLLSIIMATSHSYRKAVLIKSQEQMIYKDMEYAKQLAITKAVDISIYFYSQTYTIQTGDKVYKEIKLQPDFSVTPEHLGFTERGTPKYSGTVYLAYKRIRVSRFTVAVGSGLMQWKRLD